MEQSSPPWMVSVPVKKSTFIPLHARDSRFNLETELGAIQAFSTLRDAIPEDSVIQSDLQTNADTNINLRLGSGRAGFHRAHYLKGVGRTQLAGNWNQPLDAYHASGALLPSAAAREYLISELLQAQGAAHLITPCTGLLIRQLPRRLKDHAKNIFQITLEENPSLIFPECDLRMQAITVKAGNFSRFSNFVWWLQNFPQRQMSGRMSRDLRPVPEFLEFLHSALLGRPLRKGDETSPEDLAEAFSESILRTIHRFMEAWSLGICWGSLHNNFTADGRFLDLETPTVFPYPFLGLPTGFGKGKSEPFIFSEVGDMSQGFGIVGYLRQMQVLNRYLKSRFNLLAETGPCNRMEAMFLRQAARAMDRAVSKGHPLWNHESLRRMTAGRIKSTLSISGKSAALVDDLFWHSTARLLNGRRVKNAPVRLEKWDPPFPIASAEPHQAYQYYVPAFFKDLGLKPSPVSRQFNQGLLEVEACARPQEFLAGIRRASGALKRAVRKR